MIMIQNIIALVFIVAFFILVCLLAWYIALPLLVIGLILSFFGVFKTPNISKIIITRGQKNASHKKDDVIDVDYTEIK